MSFSFKLLLLDMLEIPSLTKAGKNKFLFINHNITISCLDINKYLYSIDNNPSRRVRNRVEVEKEIKDFIGTCDNVWLTSTELDDNISINFRDYTFTQVIQLFIKVLYHSNFSQAHVELLKYTEQMIFQYLNVCNFSLRRQILNILEDGCLGFNYEEVKADFEFDLDAVHNNI